MKHVFRTAGRGKILICLEYETLDYDAGSHGSINDNDESYFSLFLNATAVIN